MSLDFIFCILPRVDVVGPVLAPYVLKSVLENHGYSSKVYDLNLEYYKNLNDKQRDLYWHNEDRVFHRDFPEAFNELWNESFGDFCKKWARTLAEKNPKYLGLSIFSSRSFHSSLAFIKEFKKINSETKIVCGGPYATFMLGKGHDLAKITDYILEGDCEESLIQFMRGNLSYPGINSKGRQIDDLNSIPFPNYDDFDFKSLDEICPGKNVHVTASRGCVRRCDFCDVKTLWNKFQYKDGKRVAEEIRWNYQKYGRETVYFTDSLVNGSVKMFRELCATLADFRATGDLPDTFSWTGHFICHREGVMKEADYRLMKESGCSLLHIGIESGSERVRDQMGKKFSNRDIDICMEMLAKHQMSAQFLMIIGYPTETESDFQDTLRLFQKLHCLGFTAKNADGYAPLKSVSLGSTMLVDIHDEGVWKALSRHGIDNYQNTYHWSCGTNTHTERKERMKRARACLQRLKIDEPDEAKRRQDEIDNIPKIQKKRNLNQTLVL